jgi:C-terminal processing protease CtpA/Prc
MKRGFHTLALGVAIIMMISGAHAQKFDKIDRDRAQDMLHYIADDIRKHYYDPKFHGLDFDARVRQASEKIQQATSLAQAFAMVGWALDGLNDSHTYFIPPGRTFRPDYGWQMQMVGDRCFVTHVRPKSDAEAKGLTPGAEILSVNGFTPTRDNFTAMFYVFNVLAPRASLQLKIRGLDGQQRQFDVLAKVRQISKIVDLTSDNDFWDFIRQEENADRMTRTKCEELGPELAICKVPEFNLDDSAVHQLLSIARKHNGLVLDLRDNPGGYVDTLQRVLGGFFDHEVKIGDRIGRQALKPQMTKPQRHDLFTGKLVVLVDSESSSAAELFARVIQLEKRGTVVGDRSSGLVMEGRGYDHKIGSESVVFYGAMITDADIVMADGQSLEHRGVVPDETLTPAPADLNSGNDPVMAHAAELLGVKLTPEKAGKFFPYEWPKN